jgi:arsenate reductase
MTAHWGIPDPAAAVGTEAEVGFAFAEACRQLRNRIELMLNLPMASLDRMSLQHRLGEIGETADGPKR